MNPELGTGSAAVPIGPIVVVGLQREATIARAAGVQVIVGGGADRTHVGSLLDAAIAAGGRGIISFGIAGGLDPELGPGACLIGRRVVGDEAWHVADAAWVDRLGKALPAARIADIAGVDQPAADRTTKQRLHRATGAAAVDMESHVVARVAAAHGLPFAAVRVVCDPAGLGLPPAAVAGFQSDGGTNVAAVLRSLIAMPSQLPDLIRLARNARVAFDQLGRSRRALGVGFGFPDRERAVQRT